jgi:hypothetical protein
MSDNARKRMKQKEIANISNEGKKNLIGKI